MKYGHLIGTFAIGVTTIITAAAAEPRTNEALIEAVQNAAFVDEEWDGSPATTKPADARTPVAESAPAAIEELGLEILGKRSSGSPEIMEMASFPLALPARADAAELSELLIRRRFLELAEALDYQERFPPPQGAQYEIIRKEVLLLSTSIERAMVTQLSGKENLIPEEVVVAHVTAIRTNLLRQLSAELSLAPTIPIGADVLQPLLKEFEFRLKDSRSRIKARLEAESSVPGWSEVDPEARHWRVLDEITLPLIRLYLTKSTDPTRLEFFETSAASQQLDAIEARITAWERAQEVGQKAWPHEDG